ncbi:BlaI/MecI/CopY family transcriptional regulator, partial [Clostridioides difficile]|uniref:BlaI/MecI/CopY family transcriptional regulator n=1 Tax=Clostridioides difficile TaxID=1496 RepID=UPI001F439599
LLSRLVKKHFLSAEKIDRYTHYTIVVGHKEYLSVETKDFLSKLLTEGLSPATDNPNKNLNNISCHAVFTKACGINIIPAH